MLNGAVSALVAVGALGNASNGDSSANAGNFSNQEQNASNVVQIGGTNLPAGGGNQPGGVTTLLTLPVVETESLAVNIPLATSTAGGGQASASAPSGLQAQLTVPNTGGVSPLMLIAALLLSIGGILLITRRLLNS